MPDGFMTNRYSLVTVWYLPSKIRNIHPQNGSQNRYRLNRLSPQIVDSFTENYPPFNSYCAKKKVSSRNLMQDRVLPLPYFCCIILEQSKIPQRTNNNLEFLPIFKQVKLQEKPTVYWFSFVFASSNNGRTQCDWGYHTLSWRLA